MLWRRWRKRGSVGTLIWEAFWGGGFGRLGNGFGKGVGVRGGEIWVQVGGRGLGGIQEPLGDVIGGVRRASSAPNSGTQLISENGYVWGCLV